MKAKLAVILALLALLAFTVYKMMEYEESIRRDHIIVKYKEDASRPLFAPASLDELKEASAEATYYFRTGPAYFQKARIENQQTAGFDDFFLKGVNLGVALPGKFPAEFSLTFDGYLKWLEEIGEMNANVIRTYTILPPEFYKALNYYNLYHADHPLYLLQGVWATTPPDEDYLHEDYTRRFQREIMDVIDVIHGNAVLPEKPGKAHGVYTADVARYVVGYLLGREWEPLDVFKTIQKHKEEHYNGVFVQVHHANAMEIWLAKMLDFAATYEIQQYGWQHPLSFVNWLPLDPMYHHTEFIEKKTVREYDNDLSSIDFTKFHATELFHAGLYAAYHVYPYYPDFIYLQEEYRQGKGDNYFHYLTDLKQHCRGMPLVIAEYGLPSSRGVSHFNPDGFHQGGLSEAEQARLSKRLTEDIVKTRCAGAVFFEWADEWFKHNWLVMDFELPFENRKLWHNMENPEQNFGIKALEDRRKVIDGRLNDWDGIDTHSSSIQMKGFADASYFYIAAHLPGFDVRKHNLYIAIDTYDEQKGDHKLPFTNQLFDNGFEFLVTIKDTDQAKILVDEPYSVFTDIYNNHIPVYASKYNANGRFIDQWMLVNRGRESLTGEKFDSIVNNRGILQFGVSTHPAASNADWFYDTKTHHLELRLDWHLLNVSDPSHRFVLDDKAGTRTIEYSPTEGFRLYLFITDKQDSLIKQYPEGAPYFFTWETWETPVYTERKKPLYDTLQAYFARTLTQPPDSTPHITEKFEIADFYMDKPAAVSISFDEQSYSQYLYAVPVLNKYRLKATFSILPRWEHKRHFTATYNGLTVSRMGGGEWQALKKDGFEIALLCDTPPDWESLIKKHPEVRTIHMAAPCKARPPERFLFARKNTSHTYKGVTYQLIPSGLSEKQLYQTLKKGTGKWLIINYAHIYQDRLSLRNIDSTTITRRFVPLERFRRQVRLIRNSGYWIDTEQNIFKYLIEKRRVRLKTQKFGDVTFLRLMSDLDPTVYDVPLSIRYTTKAKIVRITGSQADGIYNNRTGTIILNVLPGKEVRIEKIQ